MPKYWGKQIFAHGRFPNKVGQKQKTELNDGNNNGQATHGARKCAWCTQTAWANPLSLTHELPSKNCYTFSSTVI